MTRRIATSLVALMTTLTLLGCSGFIGRSKKSYQQGMYLEAAENLGAHEEDLPYLDAGRQLEYGLYRGCSLLMLGDDVGAMRWLGYAREVEKDNPGTMRPEQVIILRQAEYQLEQRRAGPR